MGGWVGGKREEETPPPPIAPRCATSPPLLVPVSPSHSFVAHAARASFIAESRGGGSMTPEVYEAVRAAAAANAFPAPSPSSPDSSSGAASLHGTFAAILEGEEVKAVERVDTAARSMCRGDDGRSEGEAGVEGEGGSSGGGEAWPTWRLSTSAGRRLDADIVILATGTVIDALQEPLFRDVLAAAAAGGGEAGEPLPPFSPPVSSGLPHLDQTLRFPPAAAVTAAAAAGGEGGGGVGGGGLHVIGAWAALQLGPDANNLAGAQSAARLLRPILREALVDAAVGRAGTGGKTGPGPAGTGAGVAVSRGLRESLSRKLAGDGNLFAALADENEDVD